MEKKARGAGDEAVKDQWVVWNKALAECESNFCKGPMSRGQVEALFADTEYGPRCALACHPQSGPNQSYFGDKAYAFATSAKYGNLTVDFTPKCSSKVFRKNLNEVILFDTLRFEHWLIRGVRKTSDCAGLYAYA